TWKATPSRGRWQGAPKSLRQSIVRRADLLQDLQQVINLCRRVAGRHAQADATGAGGYRRRADGRRVDAVGQQGLGETERRLGISDEERNDRRAAVQGGEARLPDAVAAATPQGPTPP